MKKVLIALFLLLSYQSQARYRLPYDGPPYEDLESVSNLKVGYVLGTPYNIRHGLDIGYYHCFDGTLWGHGPSASLTLAVQDNRFYVAPKISYEAFFLVLNVKADLWYMKNNMFFTPSAGLSGLGIVNLMFGYDFCLGNSAESAFHLSLYCNINLTHRRGIRKKYR